MWKASQESMILQIALQHLHWKESSWRLVWIFQMNRFLFIAVGIIKQFVGDDPIKVEAKYKNSHTIYHKPPVLVLAGNHPIAFPNFKRAGTLESHG